MEPSGYPEYFLFFILITGIPLALLRPNKAFLYVVFLVSAADTYTFTFTRTKLLGPYFNAHDACLIVAISSLLPHCLILRKKLLIPDVVKWILLILGIGFIQSFYILGWKYDYFLLRSLRWALSLPLYFVIAATLVDEKNKVRPFLIAVLVGSVVSAIEHIYFIISHTQDFLSTSSIREIRTIAFRSPGIWLLPAGIIWLPKAKFTYRILIYGSGSLFALSVLLNQTRSIWISSVLVLPLTMFILPQKNIMIKAVVIPIAMISLFTGMIFFKTYLLPEIKLGSIIEQRGQTLLEDNQRHYSTRTRQLAIKFELGAWSEGILILGRGLNYMASNTDDKNIAWNHLGHITTLAQLGLIGFFIYSFYLPKVIIQGSRRLWKLPSPEIKFLGLLACLTMIWCWICFIMSDSFLTQNPMRGIIFGAAWSQFVLIKSINKAPEKCFTDQSIRNIQN
ncbi:hypothetical protein ACFL27_08595 [candidate division CSSED10-310 bacterium]|uniref:O-antigen ligase domain-containing protein n=1 Tax=candidate division CSSED10-310 bacterium TaxID=2855610 RepID=A0ABV6YVJ6_UNCC1